MIFDKLQNISNYYFLKPFCKEIARSEFLTGKFDLKERDGFGIGLEYNTRNEQDAVWEGHKKFLDLHVIIDGEERIQHSFIDDMIQINEYHEMDDYQLFKGDKSAEFFLNKSMFILFAPTDIHKTGIGEVNEQVKKFVFKIPLRYYDIS